MTKRDAEHDEPLVSILAGLVLLCIVVMVVLR